MLTTTRVSSLCAAIHDSWTVLSRLTSTSKCHSVSLLSWPRLQAVFSGPTKASSTMNLFRFMTLFLGATFVKSHTSESAMEASSTLQPCDGIPKVPTNRRACGFFIWDAPSALLYKWCHHLLKDHLIEGKGGHMVRRRGGISSSFDCESPLLTHPCAVCSI